MSTIASTSTVTPSVLPTYALDQALCGFTAGIVSTLVMHPLDLIKTKLQVSTTPSLLLNNLREDKGKGKMERVKGGLGREIWRSLEGVVKRDGVTGLYRGLSPNLVGNAGSWGLYFLWSVLEFLLFLEEIILAQELIG